MSDNQPKFNETQLEALLKLAAQKMGTSPEALKQSAENGQLGSALSGVQDPAMLQALQDPSAAQQLLASPQAQKLLELLQKGK